MHWDWNQKKTKGGGGILKSYKIYKCYKHAFSTRMEYNPTATTSPCTARKSVIKHTFSTRMEYNPTATTNCYGDGLVFFTSRLKV